MKTIDLNTRKIALRILSVAGVLLAIMLVLAFSSSNKDDQEQPVAAQSMPVEVAYPVYEKITEWDEYTGRFEASNRVEVRARVGGFLESVNFQDGQMVEKGDVLFTIDDRPFQIALDQANADYGQAMASLKTAQDNYDRVETLRESGAMSTEEYDRRKQALAFAKSSVQSAQARVDNAKLNLEFTRVTAPISGLVSRDKVNEGNLIDGGSSTSTLLTTIVATSPIHFYFTGSESDYLRYVRLARNGERGELRSEGIPVFIKLQDENDFVHEAKMDFVDNEIDNSTGTIESRAVLENKDHLLEPGMFGEARLMGSAAHNSLMIPDNIIGTNQSLRFVYVLGTDNVVTTKNISLGPLHSNGLRVVRDGITKDDKLIVNNIQKIRPGMPVSPVEISLLQNTQTEVSVK
ncbi:efflux RND transporter periplasmic adaptor subunit [Mesonia oceanica]|uniref:Efflux pump periplasmic linker BepD n=1 Tax=Mesonia oceanica TaxID=2687242 RepID=A0AC61Y9E7_9FLAO|nr:efflux RND transporter periplasmic adaptor subunit [Mesonia oceanica]MAQ41395.1 efflux transporter periplasmic adaptor subunit [Mesonia sp.]MBJ98514.1 efflux transporter periplasmic adaptor subunit [Flavobacteriaceae bacterium]VVV00503.1 Efflux pump periplasmic linker BepD [Mesonia oceanica]|tara:strand:+ start:1145 stop:2359 length:1215 start_codon:yes stop_codon:yes gene_type:complete